MSLEPWDQIEEELLVDMRIFQLKKLSARSPRTGRVRDLARIHSGDWVNIVPLTRERDVVMVRQYRHGTDEITLEIPGGLVDPGESPIDAAVRETREETGYTGDAAIELGWVEPNPAFLNNRCFTFFIDNCRRTHQLALDDGEDIEVVTIPLREIPGRIAEGAIRHALVVCGFQWLQMRRPDLFA